MKLPSFDGDDSRAIPIQPKAAMSRLAGSNSKYIIFMDDGGIPIVGKAFVDEDEEREFLSRMLDRWYGP